MAGKSLPESKLESESESSDSGDYGDVIDYFGEEFAKQKLEELKKKAFYSVLHAFTAESSTISNERTSIIEKLMIEWNIPQETHISFEDNIEKNLLAQQQRGDSYAFDEKEMQIVEEKPLTKSVEKKATSNTTSVATCGSSWGSVNPKSLVGKWIRVRMPGEDDFEEFVITKYDAKQEMHRLETTDTDAMEMDDLLSWIDIREVPAEDIMWQGGEKAKFDAPNQSTA